MIEAQQEYRRSTSMGVIPALLHIQELEPGCAAEKPQRRIAVLLDHPVVKRLRGRVPVRFDVISVYLLTDQPEFEHIKGAFAFREPS